uniref:Uncharacterized protein n=1 Tax=Oryzias melastigma TaxID=30732 RepID=A0A3B3CVP6_ORYME
ALLFRWSQFRDLVDQKKESLVSALGVQNYHLECNETKKLTGMERDLVAIEDKMGDLGKEAERLGSEHPEQCEAIKVRLEFLLTRSSAPVDQQDSLKNREESLGEASKLQQFLRDLDDFQSWLSRTQTAIASEDMPNTLTEAEKLLAQHENIKNEIRNYEEDYQKMRDMGEMVTQGQTDAQHMFLRQRLQALDTGWNELHKMWENRQNLLSQSHAYQLFLRDTKQAEAFLNNQEYVLAHTEMPTTLEAAEAAIKKQEDFMTTMDANEEKISSVVDTGRRLVADGNVSAEFGAPWFRCLLRSSPQLNLWINEKMLTAQDMTYDEARNLHSKWLKHQAFMAELQSNKEWLDKISKVRRAKREGGGALRIKKETEKRHTRLSEAHEAQQYYFDAAEAEAWMSEQELYMMSEEKAKVKIRSYCS